MKQTYYAVPVEGCEECELLVELHGEDATACNECVLYHHAEFRPIASLQQPSTQGGNNGS